MNLPISEGHYVLAIDGLFGDRGSLQEDLESFVTRNGGFRSIPTDQLLRVHHVAHVMPKTYDAAFNTVNRNGERFQYTRRYSRDRVIASSVNSYEMARLREDLSRIGIDADFEIEREIADFIFPVRKRIEASARAQIQGLFPVIFGGGHEG